MFLLLQGLSEILGSKMADAGGLILPGLLWWWRCLRTADKVQREQNLKEQNRTLLRYMLLITMMIIKATLCAFVIF